MSKQEKNMPEIFDNWEFALLNDTCTSNKESFVFKFQNL